MAPEPPRRVRPSVDEYTMPDGRRIFLLAEGRLVNLAAAEGHPSAVMDMSFANQFFSMMWLAKHGKKLDKKVYDVPDEQDKGVAALKLDTQGTRIDKLTAAQVKYATDYSAGT